VKHYLRNESYALCHEAFQEAFPNDTVPNITTIYSIILKIEGAGYVTDPVFIHLCIYLFVVLHVCNSDYVSLTNRIVQVQVFLSYLVFPVNIIPTRQKKSKAVPLHAMVALGGRGGIAPTYS
jgi:hypothetical protein